MSRRSKRKAISPTQQANQKQGAPGKQALTVRHEVFQGPLPHPEDLSRYDDIVPGAGHRILAMAEGEQKHVHDLDRRKINENAKDVKRGQQFAFLVAIAAFASTVCLGYFGQSTAATAVGGTTVLGLVWAFIKGRKEP